MLVILKKMNCTETASGHLLFLYSERLIQVRATLHSYGRAVAVVAVLLQRGCHMRLIKSFVTSIRDCGGDLYVGMRVF